MDGEDSNPSDWSKPYSSGDSITMSHTWGENGTYIVAAKAKDVYGAESDWASFEVTITGRTRSINIPFLN